MTARHPGGSKRAAAAAPGPSPDLDLDRDPDLGRPGDALTHRRELSA